MKRYFFPLVIIITIFSPFSVKGQGDNAILAEQLLEAIKANLTASDMKDMQEAMDMAQTAYEWAGSIETIANTKKLLEAYGKNHNKLVTYLNIISHINVETSFEIQSIRTDFDACVDYISLATSPKRMSASERIRTIDSGIERLNLANQKVVSLVRKLESIQIQEFRKLYKKELTNSNFDLTRY